MFKTFGINLTGPICNCKEQNLYPGIDWKNGFDGQIQPDSPSFKIICRTCDSILAIPLSKMLINISLDVPYPGLSKEKRIEMESEDILDNVIPFPNKKNVE